MAKLSKFQLEKYHLQKYKYGTDVRKGGQLYGMSGKIIYRGDWILKPPDKIIVVEMNEIIVVEMNEMIAEREALFYLEFKDHKHIIGTIGLIENTSNLLIFIQEFAPHNDLGSVLMYNDLKISLEILREMFRQIADAMSYVASKRIVHGDLGCRNVLVFDVDTSEPKNCLVKLTDFGLARWIDQPPENEDSTVIPIRFCAPEILRHKRHKSYSEKSDVYSMGVLMWEALSNGKIPYAAIFDDTEVEEMKKENKKLEQPPVFHPDLWELMNECWYKEPNKRPTFNEIGRRLSAIDISVVPHDPTIALPHRVRIQCDYKLHINVNMRGRLNDRSRSVFKAKWISEEEKSRIVLIKKNEEPSKHEQLIYSTFDKDHPHPNIIDTYGFVEDDDRSIMILQERARYEDLQFLLESGQFQPSPKVLVSIFLQIIDAMIAIVGKGLVHGDLRCESVLVFEMHPTDPEKNVVKLANFTLTHPNDPSYSDNRRVNVPVRYCAPEILRNVGRSNYSESSDVYSMGVLIWQAYSQGKRPYDSSNIDAEVLQRKLNGEKLPRPNNCDDKIWKIVDECWLDNPEPRYNFEGLKTLLSCINFDPVDLVHCKRCNKNIAKNEMENHSILCSSKRRIEDDESTSRVYYTRCKFCSERCLGSELDGHERSCSLNPSLPMHIRPIFSVSCNFCGEDFQDNKILHHEHTCPSRATPPLIHEPFRTVRCDHCDIEYLDSEIADHMRSCERKLPTPDPQVACTYCKRQYPLNRINNHEQSCPSKTQTPVLPPPKPAPGRNCRYCSVRHPLVHIETHERACPSKPRPPPIAEPILRVECKYCRRECHVNNLDDHERSCLSRPTTPRPQPPPIVPQTPCRYCYQQYPSTRIEIHEKSCPRRTKSCTETLFSWLCYCCAKD